MMRDHHDVDHHNDHMIDVDHMSDHHNEHERCVILHGT